MALSPERLDYMTARIRELIALRTQVDNLIHSLTAVVDSAQRPAARAPCPADPTLPLKGLKLAVIGPSARAQSYRDQIEPLGATMLFAASEEKLGRVPRVCGKAHGIIFITSYASHAVDDHVTRSSRASGVPVRRLTFKGLERLKETALEMADEMAIFKELLLEARQRN